MPKPAIHLLERRWVRWLLYFSFWTSLGLLNLAQRYLLKQSRGEFVWFDDLLGAMTDWYAWAIITPFIYRLAQRFPLDRPGWPGSLAVHLLGSVTAGLIVAATLSSVLHFAGGLTARAMTFDRIFPALVLGPFMVYYLWLYWGIVGVSHGLRYYRRYRERELQASQLAAQLAQTQLNALRTQLQPHFLFNTLQTISDLVHKDPELADNMITRLGDLLRATLDHGSVQEVPLRQELDFITTYLEIEQARFGPRLTVAIDVADGVEEALVPNLILQPLVENALRHGIGPRPEGGRLWVRALRVNGELELEVEDDGPGLPDGFQTRPGSGVGLANTRARLRGLYGESHFFRLARGRQSGLCVTMRIPSRLAARPEPALAGR